MSTTFKTRAGDTFADIARRAYGTPEEAGRIIAANPGAAEPLTSGAVITLPDLPFTSGNEAGAVPAPAATRDETAVMIDGTRFRFWDSVTIRRAVDEIDSLDLTAPFDSNAPGFRETFRPFSYKDTVVTVGGEALFTGTAVALDTSLENTGRTAALRAYAKPGVLNDCMPPASLFPLEFNGADIREIAESLTAPFGVGVDFSGEAEPGPVFERLACEPGRTVLDFLTEPAQQRNLIIASDVEGNLLFRRPSTPAQPSARLSQGVSPVTGVSSRFTPQSYFSHITALEPAGAAKKGSQYTVKNERLQGVTRPFTFTARDTDGGDIAAAADAKAARMFGNMASYSVDVATWRDASDSLWEPGAAVELIAPDVMIYTPYMFMIRAVTFNRGGNETTATLELSLPGAFGGEQPERLPWEE